MTNPRRSCNLCGARKQTCVRIVVGGPGIMAYICRDCIEVVRAWLPNVPVPGSGDKGGV